MCLHFRKAVLIFGLIPIASLAFAEPRKVDFTAPIVIDGKPLIDDFKCPIPIDKDGKPTGPRPCETPASVGEMAYFALERPTPGQHWEDAIKRDDLARAIRNAKDFPLLDDQRTMIETAMGPLWSPRILGEVKAIIDPASTKK